MRIGNRLHRQKDADLNNSMTSMIDVVFLLLIFFLTTTTFIEPEKELHSNIVVEQNQSGLQQNDLEPAIIDVFQVAGTIFYQVGSLKTSDSRQLTDALKKFPNKTEGGFVRVTGEIPFQVAAEVISILYSSGFENVSYLPAN